MAWYSVYVIGPDSAKPLKVGIAKDITRRLASLQTGSHQALYVHWEFNRLTDWEAKRLEKAAHKRLKHYRIRGEWFDTDLETAIDAVWSQLNTRVYTARQLSRFDLRGHVKPEDWEQIAKVARTRIIDAETIQEGA